MVGCVCILAMDLPTVLHTYTLIDHRYNYLQTECKQFDDVYVLKSLISLQWLEAPDRSPSSWNGVHVEATLVNGMQRLCGSNLVRHYCEGHCSGNVPQLRSRNCFHCTTPAVLP